MRAGLLAFALAVVAAACGASETSSDGSPTVEITSIELDGPSVAIGFEVAAEGDLPTAQVNWGDDTPSPEIRDEGSLTDSHTYPDDVVEATIVVTVVDEEGAAASAARSISVLLEPTVALRLDTDGAEGNSAGFDMAVVGRTAAAEFGSATSTHSSIGADDELVLPNSAERLGFGGSFPVDGDLTIVWTVTCRAHGADSLFLPFSISTCDALDDSRGVSLATAQLTIRAPDG